MRALGADAPWARRLTAAGREEDVAACLQLDSTRVVPVWEPAARRLVAWTAQGVAA